MKTILDKTTRGELIGRINSLNENSKAQWGKMNIFQMLRHCVICEEMYLGKKKYPRSFMGLLFGRMGLKNMLKDDSPMGRNAPTAPEFRVSENSGDVLAEKRKWIGLIEFFRSL